MIRLAPSLPCKLSLADLPAPDSRDLQLRVMPRRPFEDSLFPLQAVNGSVHTTTISTLYGSLPSTICKVRSRLQTPMPQASADRMPSGIREACKTWLSQDAVSHCEPTIVAPLRRKTVRLYTTRIRIKLLEAPIRSRNRRRSECVEGRPIRQCELVPADHCPS